MLIADGLPRLRTNESLTNQNELPSDESLSNQNELPSNSSSFLPTHHDESSSVDFSPKYERTYDDDPSYSCYTHRNEWWRWWIISTFFSKLSKCVIILKCPFFSNVRVTHCPLSSRNRVPYSCQFIHYPPFAKTGKRSAKYEMVFWVISAIVWFTIELWITCNHLRSDLNYLNQSYFHPQIRLLMWGSFSCAIWLWLSVIILMPCVSFPITRKLIQLGFITLLHKNK